MSLKGDYREFRRLQQLVDKTAGGGAAEAAAPGLSSRTRSVRQFGRAIPQDRPMLLAYRLHHGKGAALQPAARERLASVVHARGQKYVLARLGLSEGALARAMAGLRILSGTAHLILAGLDRLDAEDQRLADVDRLEAELGLSGGRR